VSVAIAGGSRLPDLTHTGPRQPLDHYRLGFITVCPVAVEFSGQHYAQALVESPSRHADKIDPDVIITAWLERIVGLQVACRRGSRPLGL
jgi:hypothetical protein